MIVPLLQAKAELFRTLGHPVRIRILELLTERDHDVTELFSAFEADPTTLNDHLSALRHARLIGVVRTGALVTYTLLTPSIANLLTDGRRVLAEHLAEHEQPRYADRPD
ncbi:MAG: ArsR/SmtB family transcription factor [Actinomycetales bacterium]